MKFLFVMDPLARLQIAGDSTFAIMLAAQTRGHDIWFCEPRHLSLEHADAVSRAWAASMMAKVVSPAICSRASGSITNRNFMSSF